MIGTRELQQLRAEWTLDIPVIEKDYVLGWLLAGIAQHRALSRSWVFKGGTCLRKCYYETFRFSEDLDFTVTQGGPEDPRDSNRGTSRTTRTEQQVRPAWQTASRANLLEAVARCFHHTKSKK